jgi:hypothetical protein
VDTLRSKSRIWPSNPRRLQQPPTHQLAEEFVLCRSLSEQVGRLCGSMPANATACMDLEGLNVCTNGTEHILGRWSQTFCHRIRGSGKSDWRENILQTKIVTKTGKPDVDALIQALAPMKKQDAVWIRRDIVAYLTEIPTHYRRLAAPFEDAQWAILRSIWLDPEIAYLVDTKITRETRPGIQGELSRYLSSKLDDTSIRSLIHALKFPRVGELERLNG